jgi:spermidine synthase
MTSFRSLGFRIALYFAFFASGAASLVAEVTWNRMLIVVVGNSLSAAAMIIVVFMGGLGLGSWLGGRAFSGRRRSLIPYVALELAVGLYVLLSPALFDGLAALFTSLSSGSDARSGLTLVRLIVSLLALLLPATLMGATFPAIISGAAPDSPTRRSARTGYLYSTNTLGAAVGCFAAGYHLLFELGVRTTLAVAFGLYVTAAVSALVATAARRRKAPVGAAGRQVAAEAGAATAPAHGPETADDGRRRFLALATFGIGFVALAYEVLLTRLSILYLGNSVSVFPLVLTAFLLGTGFSAIAGTWAYGVLSRRGLGDRLFGITALAAGACVLITPYLLLTDWVVDTAQFARFADMSPRNPASILAIITAPTVLLGALLPLAIRMLQREERGAATRQAATLYALNTAGGVIGAGIANHFLVPWIGVQGVVSALTAICVSIGAAILFRAGSAARRWKIAALGTGAAVLALGAALPGVMTLYAAKIAQSTLAEEVTVRLVHEGRAATVTVLDQKDARSGTYRDMYLNGVEEASTRYWHAQLFKLLGILPPLLHESPDPKHALVIAFGAGITAGSVLASDEVGRLDVVDLNPDIEGINDLFTDVNGDVFHQPRFHFHNDDGRNYLVTSGETYDLIIGDSTHPRAYDSWILYTEEFYRAVRARLRPGGIFAQWVPVLGSMRGELFRIHLNTFRTVFPDATFWYVYGSDQAFLLATPEAMTLDAARLQEKLHRLPGWFRADEYQLDTVARVAGFFWMDPRAMELLIAGETRINRDDLHYFDKQSAVRPLPPDRQLPRFQTDASPHVAGAGPDVRAELRTQQQVAGLLAEYAFYRDTTALHRAFCIRPENGNVRLWMSLEFAGAVPDPGTFCGDEAVRGAREALARRPGDPLAMNELADLLCGSGQHEEALALARRAAEIAPDHGMIQDTLGWALFLQGRNDEALAALERSRATLGDHPIVLYHLGAVHREAGRVEDARSCLSRALRGGDFPFAEEARRLLSALPPAAAPGR